MECTLSCSCSSMSCPTLVPYFVCVCVGVQSFRSLARKTFINHMLRVLMLWSTQPSTSDTLYNACSRFLYTNWNLSAGLNGAINFVKTFCNLKTVDSVLLLEIIQNLKEFCIQLWGYIFNDIIKESPRINSINRNLLDDFTISIDRNEPRWRFDRLTTAHFRLWLFECM